MRAQFRSAVMPPAFDAMPPPRRLLSRCRPMMRRRRPLYAAVSPSGDG